MKQNYLYFEDITSYANNFIWYTGENTGSTANGSNPIERMKLLENGNLGIGTTSPTTKLHIYDDIANTSNTASTNLTNQMLILETKYNHDWNNPHSANPSGAPHTGGSGITFKISDNNNKK